MKELSMFLSLEGHCKYEKLKKKDVIIDYIIENIFREGGRGAEQRERGREGRRFRKNDFLKVFILIRVCLRVKQMKAEKSTVHEVK